MIKSRPIGPAVGVWELKVRPDINDPTGWIFLARVVEQVGTAYAGSDWNSEDMAVPEWRPSTQLGLLDASLGSGLLSGIPKESEHVAAARARADKIRQLIAREAEAGRIQTGYRLKLGGPVVTCPREWWDTEQLPSRFAKCTIDPANPFLDPTDVVGAAYLFVEQKGLEHLLKTRNAKQNNKKRRRGRKKGSGPYHLQDDKLVDKMQELMTRSVNPLARYSAAQEVSSSAEGSTHGDSIARRLDRKHKAKYPDAT